MARISRPPGFDMTYRPAGAVFGIPWLKRLPAWVYLGLAVALFALVHLADYSDPDSGLFQYMVVQDQKRPLPAKVIVVLFLVGAVSAVIRSGMRGVRIRPDGIEAREITALIMPQVRQVRWAQIDVIRLDIERCIALEMWDGSRVELPEVQDRAGLSDQLEMIAAARAIPIRGARGLDDLADVEDYSQAD